MLVGEGASEKHVCYSVPASTKRRWCFANNSRLFARRHNCGGHRFGPIHQEPQMLEVIKCYREMALLKGAGACHHHPIVQVVQYVSYATFPERG